MSESLTPHIVANEVRMMRTQYKGALLLVEGPSDKKTYWNLIDQTRCRVVIGRGKENVIGALRILEGERFPGVLAVVDADFENLERLPPCSGNLLFTDLHDLECMMVTSRAFPKLLGEFATADRVAALEIRTGCDLATLLAKRAGTIGYLRWFSLRQNLGLVFEGMSFGRFVRPDDLATDFVELFREVKNRSQKPQMGEAFLRSGIDSLRDASHDPWQVACGHDILAILSYALRFVIAAHDHVRVSQDSLERALRLAYESEHFRQTRLYAAIRNWEAEHPTYAFMPTAP